MVWVGGIKICLFAEKSKQLARGNDTVWQVPKRKRLLQILQALVANRQEEVFLAFKVMV